MPFPTTPSLVVFDKDGVLVDLRTWLPMIVGIAEYLVDRGAALGDDTLDRDKLLDAVGVEMRPGEVEGHIVDDGVFARGTFIAMRETWQEVAPSLTPVFADLETYISDIRRIRMETARGNSIAKGEVAATLDELRRAGWALAIATNDTENSARMNFDELGIADAFDAVICADTGFGSKPDPGMLLEICRATGIPPEQAVMVGDTGFDREASINAGFGGFVAIADSAPDLPEYIPSADAVIREVSELPALLKDHLGAES